MRPLETNPDTCHFSMEQLAGKRLPDLVGKEHAETGIIRLYGANGYWNSFEGSAYQVSRLSARHDVVIFHHKECPSPVIMVSVTAEALDAFGRKLVLRCKEPGYREYVGMDMPDRQYSRWHRMTASGEP